MKRGFVPDSGDIVWLDFDPQAGREQAGKRPALILSPKSYNDVVGLAIVCPITSREKGYPFEVKIASKKITGVILADHVKSLDWRTRSAKLIDRTSEESLLEVVAKLITILPSSRS